MLSAAHILAMDAKNLLDVIDSIRIRHPEVNEFVCSGGSQSSECDLQDDGSEMQQVQSPHSQRSSLERKKVPPLSSSVQVAAVTASVVPQQAQYSVARKLPLVGLATSVSDTASNGPVVPLDS
ncbi:hypothetical protein PR048_029390 [Dryococelus australis]|uniref:Focal AT domain-containing protein n=1 Tax=Dryococelus australis TaxID=614101 RepID=A0ABQ9GDA2_9NEOP|nr:hypothetical protein PR048_029390 [Dryococelus australis]